MTSFTVIPPESFASRLATFTSWPHVCPSASAVAHAGFHQIYDPAFPAPDLVLCSSCGLDPMEWDNEMDPFEFHATRSSECPFVRVTQQKKKLRNQKTRQQYKKRMTLQRATPPTPKQATQPATTPEQEQHTAENIAEKATTSTINTSLLPTTPHQAAKQLDREPPHHSKSHSCNSFRLRFLKKPCHHTALTSRLNSLPGYMEYAKELEATGQG